MIRGTKYQLERKIQSFINVISPLRYLVFWETGKNIYLNWKKSQNNNFHWLACCLISGMIRHSIIYAENDFDDYYLLKTAFTEAREDIDLVHVDDGWELLDHLQKINLPSLYPSLIILDINMNGIGGKETLQLLKATRRYAQIPVVMFTSSEREEDRRYYQAYDIEMISKPSTFQDLVKKAQYFGEQCDMAVMKKAS